MTVHEKPLAEVTQRAIHVLSCEMGVADTMRFMNQFVTGSGDYTEERKAIFENVSLNDILSAVRRSSPPPEG